MARAMFAGTDDDRVEVIWEFGSRRIPTLASNVKVTFFTAETGGSQVTDLTEDAAGTVPISAVTSDAEGYIGAFYGPDTVTSLWAQADGTTRRFLMTTTDAAALSAAADRAETAAASASTSAASVAREQPNGTAGLDAAGKLYEIRLPDSVAKVNEAPLSPYRYGFVGDGVADDTIALQNTLNALPEGGEARLPHTGNAKITAPLSITKALALRGTNREKQRILAVGCDGFQVAAGVDSVTLEGFEIAASSRYSAAANAFVAVNVDGTTLDHPSEHLYRNLFCDGFHTAFRTRYLWSSRFEGVRSAFGLMGIDAYGKSVNNFVSNSRLNVEKVAGSRGIRLYGRESFTDATVVASEGWVIDQSLTYGAEVGVDCVGTNHVYLTGAILDFCQTIGLRAIHNGTAFANNVGLFNSYVGMDGAAGDAAVKLANTVAHAQRRAARIIGNEFTVYGGKVAQRAVHVSGSEARAVIEGNTSTFFATRDIEMASPGNIVRGNECLSAVSLNIYSEVANLVADNIGTVFRPGTGPETQPYRRDSLGRKFTHGTAAPAAGTWALGDRVAQATPAVGSPKGWVCTAAGTPGTWVSEGNL